MKSQKNIIGVFVYMDEKKIKPKMEFKEKIIVHKRECLKIIKKVR